VTGRPWHSGGQVTLLLGDARDQLAQMPAASADCVVTSPPYYRLRDYGVPGQYGLEDTPDAYIAHLRAVFGETHRVLAADGTLWLNLGDCYVSGPTGPRRSSGLAGRPNAATTPHRSGGKNGGGRPAKSLLGMPWRVAFALQDDGWLLRSCVIWHKPNAMPESVGDRPAAKHEYLFLFAKQARYWFDLDPIRVPLKRPEALLRGNLVFGGARKGQHGGIGATARRRGHNVYGAKYDATPRVWAGRLPGANMRPGRHHDAASLRGANPGTVWTIPTRPLKQAHFAPFPIDLPLRAIAAGCPPARCATCRRPRRRRQRPGHPAPQPGHARPPWLRAPGHTPVRRARPLQRCRHHRLGRPPARPRLCRHRHQPRLPRPGPPAARVLPGRPLKPGSRRMTRQGGTRSRNAGTGHRRGLRVAGARAAGNAAAGTPAERRMTRERRPAARALATACQHPTGGTEASLHPGTHRQHLRRGRRPAAWQAARHAKARYVS